MTDSFLLDWKRYIENDKRTFSTNQGPTSDEPADVSLHAVDGIRLVDAWRQGRRVETQLGRQDDGEPVRDWLRRQPQRSPLHDAARLETSVAVLLATVLGQRVEDATQTGAMLFPSFIAGCIAMMGGGPTHFDEYHNMALVLVGNKTFYILPHDAIPAVRRGKYWNQRPPRLNPFNPEYASMPWMKVTLRPGDVFYLPPFWWHYVVSAPQCVMTNVWLEV